MKKSLVSQVEQTLLSENKSDYLVAGLKNWSLLRRHVHLIESYCKRNFNGEIPPKQYLSQILQLATVDEQRGNLSQPKRRRVHENPAKSVLESHGVNSFVSLYEPKSMAEEEAQLELALQASACHNH